MNYRQQPLTLDSNKLQGLSNRLIASHYENNYAGAVKRLNAIREQLDALAWDQTTGFLINGLKREELIAANSAYLHELYFDCLGGDGVLPSNGLSVALERDFGSGERWHKEFTATAKALAGGSGWALLSWSPREGRLVNHWAADHTHLLAGAIPVLALDMYEHAYHLDYGAKAADYVDAFMRNIGWERAYQRYSQAVSASTIEWGIDVATLRQKLDTVILLDVRRRETQSQSKEHMTGAVWRDPSQAHQWAAELPAGQLVVVCCVHGHDVSGSTVLALRAHGKDARILIGGLQAWREEGLPMQTNSSSPVK